MRAWASETGRTRAHYILTASGATLSHCESATSINGGTFVSNNIHHNGEKGPRGVSFDLGHSPRFTTQWIVTRDRYATPTHAQKSSSIWRTKRTELWFGSLQINTDITSVYMLNVLGGRFITGDPFPRRIRILLQRVYPRHKHVDLLPRRLQLRLHLWEPCRRVLRRHSSRHSVHTRTTWVIPGKFLLRLVINHLLGCRAQLRLEALSREGTCADAAQVRILAQSCARAWGAAHFRGEREGRDGCNPAAHSHLGYFCSVAVSAASDMPEEDSGETEKKYRQRHCNCGNHRGRYSVPMRSLSIGIKIAYIFGNEADREVIDSTELLLRWSDGTGRIDGKVSDGKGGNEKNGVVKASLEAPSWPRPN
ncbi:hypothetical protein DFH08DRAFT_822463 [Mycena albidolilacea]|uniref:Uncharacterized protein n=1 Tax=Mycena albidolilacea TaxID=1033008 RepID=A0AAD6Z8M4_9AGAR|nr:hypothetical protein DFH08DRAFT_822463 [Mycena albidolilacea]